MKVDVEKVTKKYDELISLLLADRYPYHYLPSFREGVIMGIKKAKEILLEEVVRES